MNEAIVVTKSMDEKLANSTHLSVVLNQEKEITIETTKKANEESTSFKHKLEVFKHEHALLACEQASIKYRHSHDGG